MKTTRHSLMAKGILVLLSLLILVFIFTYSWFLPPNYPVSANGISLTTTADASFEMAIGFTTPETAGQYVISRFYSGDENIDFEHVEVPATVTLSFPGDDEPWTYTNPSQAVPTYNLLVDFKPIDLTGDGVTLARPEMAYKNRSINYEATTLDHTVEPNQQYVSFDLIIRSPASDYSISLKSGSYVVGVCEASDLELPALRSALESNPSYLSVSKANEGAASGTYSKLKGSSVVRKSSYGDFSEDSVVGAVRMSFTQYLTTGISDLGDFLDQLKNTALNNSGVAASKLNAEKSLLWIPRPDIYLQDDADSENPWTLITKADAEWNNTVVDNDAHDFSIGENTYAEEAAIHRYYDDSKINVLPVEGSYAARYSTKAAVTDIAAAENTVILDSVVNAVDSAEMTYGVCRVNLWIEGTDAEARRAVDGGAFFFGFDLSGSN